MDAATISPGLGGFFAPGFEPVAARLAASLAAGEELGAAFAAYRGEEPLVDLWGGLADREASRPWRRDTVGVIFSGTKALSALCVLALIEEGLLSLETPLARYWPEFGGAGKGGILLSHALSHQAGVPGFRTPIDADEVPDHLSMAAHLAAEEPFWAPGERTVYHRLTYGWLCSEPVRRVSGTSIGALWRRRFAEPLGLDAWIGLPAALEPRVARLELSQGWSGYRSRGPLGEISAADFASICENPEVLERPADAFNRSDFHRGEIPGAGGIAGASSLARLYGILAAGGEGAGGRILRPSTVELGQTAIAEGIDPCDGDHMVYGVGLALQNESREFGPAARAFGHGGAGGSRHGAWPEEGVGFSYLMNLMRDDPGDRRAEDMLAVLHACL